jgi:ATP-dependent RNA helicase RhlE
LSTFSEFGLAPPIQTALAAEGYEHPTPIQAQAIPHVMAGRDLCGIAQTGTGKTAAFALPILHRLQAAPKPPIRKSCRVLVLSPTRELASQIADSFRAYGRGLRLRTAVVYGGVTIGKQERELSPGVDVLVATPGRLLDLVDRRALTLGDVEILVLDEADQMLDLGFIHALRRIVKLLPRQRQTLFFSATMPNAIATLAEEYLRDPVKVAVAPVATTAERVEHSVLHVAASRKPALLATLLRDPGIERVLVFTRTKHGADKVVRHLEHEGIAAAAIHGNKSQPQRERALGAFRDGSSRVLVATDIAARGIDVEGVSHVVNYDLPNVPESYVHRIGRTARAGAAGVAISFCNAEERAFLRDIEKLTRLKVPVAPLPPGFVAGDFAADPSIAARGARPPRQGSGRQGQAREGSSRPGQAQGRPVQQRPAHPGPIRQGRPGERSSGGQRPGGNAPRSAEHRPDGARERAEARPHRGRPGGGRPEGGASRHDGQSIGWLGTGARRAPR